MRLGIDVGSRWIVAAVADRGNYPLVFFEGEHTVPREYFPPLIAVQAGKRIYGWDAWSAQSDPHVRVLAGSAPGAGFWASSSTPELLAEIASALHNALDNALNRTETEQYEATLGVPVQSATSEHARIVEAFRRSEFKVLDLIEEPLADAMEYERAHSHAANIVVCHLGARLSDAAVIASHKMSPKILASVPLDISADQFDAILGELALTQVSLPTALSVEALFSLREECRRQRESLIPSAQHVPLDLGSIVNDGYVVSVPMEAIQAEWQPQLDSSIQAIERLLETFKGSITPIYVTGEASELPFVFSTLKRAFVGQVYRSANGRATTAVGLAIAAEQMNVDEIRSETKLSSRNVPEGTATPTTNIDPEHWLAVFMHNVAAEYHALGQKMTFERVSELLNQNRQMYLKDIETTRRMIRAYPELFVEEQKQGTRAPKNRRQNVE